MAAKNLWGDLPKVSQVRTPEQILREQAEELTKLTNGLIVGVVDSKTQYSLGPFTHALRLRAPTLNNYTIAIVEIGYNIGFYPVTGVSIVDTGLGSGRCENEEEFVAFLGEILGSEETHRVIKALLAHIQSTKS